ncbi:hypothetical protein L2E82_20874 [Cichorium intybus]|uniref:Uncharacterized protein n=1 Tax=Cichorium intybus TaxID=13427 RepID=A0ACB9DUV0_CICIN|nr:hypothetical protein L2E82_20874 [Cichorium intybus]
MAWNWVVQALANFKQVDPSTLVGVAKKAPAIPDDLGKDSREMVYLRILESLFIHGDEATIDTHSSQNYKISFDPSEQCEDVLKKILEETSEPMTELERQKWNVIPFVMHKRASLSKNPLQKLKEELFEGSHPLLASLKEKSKLGSPNLPENSRSSQRTSLEVNVDFNDQTTVSKDDLAPMNPVNESNKLPKSPLHTSNHVDNSTSTISKHIERKEHEMPKESPIKSLEENMSMDHVDQTPSKNLEQSCGNANVDRGQQELTGHDDDGHVPNVSNNGPSDDGKKDIENEKSDDEMIDIAAMKEAFLNSQYTVSQDSMATIDSTEICLCMKCNKGGKLLVCGSDTCQVRVHENCLNLTTTLDENGKFFCPFCAYSHAISEYLKVKKKASLARKDLQVFISSGVAHKKVPSKKGTVLDKNKSKQTEAAGEKVKDNTDIHLNNEFSNPHKRKLNEKESHVSSHPRKCREQKPQYKSPTILLIRRKKLQWTKSEVEILKEGVERYSNDDNKGIPWRDILEFGRDVFHKSRTTIDLKDKWRNICKGSPASKKPKL